jgi:hypothetical protein
MMVMVTQQSQQAGKLLGTKARGWYSKDGIYNILFSSSVT